MKEFLLGDQFNYIDRQYNVKDLIVKGVNKEIVDTVLKFLLRISKMETARPEVKKILVSI